MDCTEASNSIASTGDADLNLEFQSPFVSSFNDTADPDHRVDEIQEQLKKQLNFKQCERKDEVGKVIDGGEAEDLDHDDKFSIGWHQDNDFNSAGESIGEQEEELNHNDNYGYDKVGGDDYNDDDVEGVEKKDERINGVINNGRQRQHLFQYPVRPEAEDCSYYMKYGTCKFGSNCKFNHPVRRKIQVAKEKVKEREEASESACQTECKYYLRTGGCKYGRACRYNHSRERAPVLPANTTAFPALDLNFLGFPIRPGERECPYYMRNGSCKYGANCWFNHPELTSAGGNDPSSAPSNGESASLQNSLQPNMVAWSSPRGLNETPPFMPILFSPNQGVPLLNPKWNGCYQAPIYSIERSAHQPPAYVLSNQTTDPNVYAHQQQLPFNEFPERPGQPECSYYMKTGDCKFKSNCKYHHPKNHISKTPSCALSDKGLPLRPGQSICSYYSRYGICKFGPGCKFDHPIQEVSSPGSADDSGTPSGDSG